jgi:hypothetical protein
MTKVIAEMKYKHIPTEMPERTGPFEKLKHNYLYQFLDLSQRHKFELNRRP